MSAPEIGTRGHWATGRLPNRVNWSHPLAKGLIFCAQGDVDLVSGVVATGSGGGIDRNSPIQYGKALRVTVFTAHPTWPYQLIKSQLTTELSMFAYMQQGPGADGIGFGCINLAAAGSGEFVLKSKSGTLAFQCETAQGGTTSAVVSSEQCSVGCVVTGTPQSTDIYKNGIFLNNVNFIPYPGTSSALAVDIGTAGSVDLEGAAAVSVGMIWNRALSRADMAQLHANAFQVLRPG